MTEHPRSPQYQSPTPMIQGVLLGLELEAAGLAMVLVEVEEEAIIVEVADEVHLNQSLKVEALVEVESGVEEDVQVVRMGDQIIIVAQVVVPPVDTRVLNA